MPPNDTDPADSSNYVLGLKIRESPILVRFATIEIVSLVNEERRRHDGSCVL